MVPLHVHMVPPHVKCLHVLSDSYVPHTLYGIGIVWYTHYVCMVPPHVQYDVNDLWSPHMLYGIGI